MKKLVTVTAICVATLLVILPMAYGQDNPQARPQQDKVFQGQLTKVDANAKSISVKGPGDMEMTFQYTDATPVVGEKNVQGLTGKTGTDLKVTYRTVDGKNMATKIEIVDKETR